MQPPAYFERIRDAARRRWDQLEGDPELAGPWHQLFRQVQSPRHILSELLQNADDAQATEATVCITDGRFAFTHNGQDFSEDHFASLCRFGYSNKRTLHTIGFRGVGFKSTFSLGDTVELCTPTLSVAFDRQRFTEPRWAPRSVVGGQGLTTVAVAITDERRQLEVEKNLQEWLRSPVSLLFFKHIRRVEIDGQDVHWRAMRAGPVDGSDWMALHHAPNEEFLLARSDAEPFPTDALAEIRQERALAADAEAELPSCRVEIVLGLAGRLYVVLPTGVETKLPFACNAPFVQDPVRVKIKDPEISPTNRWLLHRVGTLAATVMLRWLESTSAGLADRSRAYNLLPDVDREDSSLEGACGTAIERAFAEAIQSTSYLLSTGGDLLPEGRAALVPQDILDVWPQATSLLDSEHRPALSTYVSEDDQEKLLHWGAVEKIGLASLVIALRSTHLPKPTSWARLLKLWAYVAPEFTGYRPQVNDLRLLPVQGKEILYSADEVVRLGEQRLLESDADSQFLSAHLLIVNYNWPRFLAEQRRKAQSDASLREAQAAQALLKTMGLEESSDVSKVIDRVAAGFFAQKVTLADCVRLARIAAKLGATVGKSFRFATQDKRLRKPAEGLVFDRDGTLAPFLPLDWSSDHVLHSEYSGPFSSCSADEWLTWVTSGRASLSLFPFIAAERSTLWNRQAVESELRTRGFRGVFSYPYVPSHFEIEDWDFPEILWETWAGLASEDPRVWGRLGDRVLRQPVWFWTGATSGRAFQVATTGSRKPIIAEPFAPAWIRRLRELPCLSDTRGFFHAPAELFRRTAETESLMDVEPFVHSHLDTEACRPLLRLLGVRDTPTGPAGLLDRLRALSKGSRPPVHEVDKWYGRLDRMAYSCSSEDFALIRNAFRDEKIILSEGGEWVSSSTVFLAADEEDVPGAALIRASVRDLALWPKLAIVERPTATLAIQWLAGLPSGSALSQDDARRVRALLARHAVRIWNECGHWLNLAGQWVPAGTLDYALTMQSLVPWSHLHEWVKQKTADLQRLPADVAEGPPFGALPHLGSCIVDRLHNGAFHSQPKESKPWLNRLGEELCRVELDTDADTRRVRALAADLAVTAWQATGGLEIVPYIDGTPAGTQRSTEAVWLDRVLYIEPRPIARLARIVSQELARAFGRPDVGDAIKLCFERPPDFVTEYLEANFRLASRETLSVDSYPAADLPEGAVPASQDLPAESGEPSGEAAAAGELQGSDVVIDPMHDAVATGAEPKQEPLVAQDHRHVPAPRAAGPSLMERFARGLGFQPDGADRFFHGNGGWIAKVRDASFPWERRDASGQLVRHYWPKDHCLERAPLQLEAHLWALLEKHPDEYALVLSGPGGEPLELPGTRLVGLRARGGLTLYPATYRLILEYDDRPVTPSPNDPIQR